MPPHKRKAAAKGTHKHDDFDKYYYYHASVQSPDTDVEFFESTYKALRKKNAMLLREDFCGTHAVACEWIKSNKKRHAYGVDLDNEPIAYGQENYASQLNSEQRKRLHILNENVLNKDLPSADITVACNFSYFIFRERELLRAYFKNVLQALKKDGIFIVDCFGGSMCHEPNEENRKIKNFTYYWEQVSFDPVSNRARFYIHFKLKGQARRERVFSYNWRMWSIPEIREIMEEAGFNSTHVYWEGTSKNSNGNGIFTKTEVGEDCDAWIAYVVGCK